MKTYKYLVPALLACLILGGSFSLARADGGVPPLDGSDSTATSTPAVTSTVPPVTGSDDASTTSTVPPVTGGDTGSTTSIIPPTTGGDTGSTTSIIPPLFGSNNTDGTSTPSAPQTFTLSVQVTGGNASDTVTSADGSIDCVVSGSSCSLSTTTGAVISLTANAVSGDTFSGWSGACTGSDGACSITLTADTSVTATFTTPSSGTTQTGGSSSSSGGGYSSGGGSVYVPLATTTATTSPSTLGAALTCPLLTDYIIPGKVNNPNDISKLQIFLNVYDQANLAVNGVLNPATESAIKAFQAKYLSQIMGPWGVKAPSGEVYITTLTKINSITCNTPLTLTAQDIAIINAYRTQLAQATEAGATANQAGANDADTANTANVSPASLITPSSDATVSATTSTTTDPDNSALTGNAESVVNTGFFGRILSAIVDWFKSK